VTVLKYPVLTRLCVCFTAFCVGCSLFKVQGAPLPPGSRQASPGMSEPGLFGLTGEDWSILAGSLATTLAIIGHRIWFHKGTKNKS
jgi:hypothetical protein